VLRRTRRSHRRLVGRDGRPGCAAESASTTRATRRPEAAQTAAPAC
jgi:hypothetical protein